MSYNVICDRCGFQYKDDELRKEWTGLMVCEPCFEHRHPQDLIRPVRDNYPLPYTRPESDGIDVGPEFNCTTATLITVPSSIVGPMIFGKGYSIGPVFIHDVEVTVHCSWTID